MHSNGCGLCITTKMQVLTKLLHSLLLYFFLFLVSWGGVRLSPLGTSAVTNWPILPVPDDRWWVWSSQWNEYRQGKPRYSEETCPSATLSTTNPTWPDLGSNPGRRGGKPATNRLSYGTDYFFLDQRPKRNVLWGFQPFVCMFYLRNCYTISVKFGIGSSDLVVELL
jgi:hypothetical protein